MVLAVFLMENSDSVVCRNILPRAYFQTQRLAIVSGRARALRFFDAPLEPDAPHRFINLMGVNAIQPRSGGRI